MPNFISRLVNCTVSGIKGVCPRLTRGTIGQRDSDDTAVLSCLHFKQVLQWVLQGDIYSTTHAYTLCQQTTGLSSGVFSLRCSEKKKGGGLVGERGKPRRLAVGLSEEATRMYQCQRFTVAQKQLLPPKKYLTKTGQRGPRDWGASIQF